MDKIIYGSKMKKVDSYTMDVIGIPSMVLMERAAFSVFMYIKENLKKSEKILCVCGMGNNGADGIALARMLHIEGYSVDVMSVGDEAKATVQWKEQRDIAINCGVSVQNIAGMVGTACKDFTYTNENSEIGKVIQGYDCIVDGLFGIGLTRKAEGIYADVIKAVNKEYTEKRKQGRNFKVYAIDVPSGLCADTGKIMGVAMKADITFTFGAMKTGLILYNGRDIAGEIVVNNIGFPENAYKTGLVKSDICKMVSKRDLSEIIKRKQHSNKGSYGKILVIGGSEKVYGALYFSAMAACRMGCGLIRLITHDNNRNLIYDKLPEAMIDTYETCEEEAMIREKVRDAVLWSDVVVIGPGLGKSREAKILLESAMKISKEEEKAIVIDADGLNLIAENSELKSYYHHKTIITPHVGEACRLMGKNAEEVAGDVIGIAGMYARENGINIILKDSTTVILGIESSEDKCNNRVCINTSGNAGMATGGSGDVLTGIVAATVAGGVDVEALQEYKESCDKINEKIFLAASVAVYIHGSAGDMAAKEVGEVSMTASDILDMIPKVLTIS